MTGQARGWRRSSAREVLVLSFVLAVVGIVFGLWPLIAFGSFWAGAVVSDMIRFNEGTGG